MKNSLRNTIPALEQTLYVVLITHPLPSPGSDSFVGPPRTEITKAPG